MNQPNVRKNYIFRLLYEILNLITPFVTAPYTARVLGAERIGIFSYTYSIMGYFMLFAALGTVSYGAREIAQHRDDRAAVSKLFWEIELMTVGTSAVCLAGWGALVAGSTEYRPYFIALTPYLVGTMLDISWLFSGYEQFGRIVLRNAVCKIAGIALLFLLVKGPEDLTVYIAINASVMMLGNLSMWTYLPGMLEKVDFRTLRFRRHFRETLIYFIPGIAASIHTMLDRTLIGLITRDSFQNGYYEQAQKIADIGKTFVFSSINTVMGPRISYLFSAGKTEEIRGRIRRSMDFILLVGFPFVLGVIAVADRFVPLFFGPGYEPVVPLMRALVPIVLIIGVSNCLGSQYFVPSGQRLRSAKILVLGAALNLCLNLLLIPPMGAMGAVIASLAAETVISALYVRLCQGMLTFPMLWKMSWKRLTAGGVMCAAVLLFGRLCPLGDLVTLILQVLLGAGIYLGLLLLARDGLLRELLGIIREFLKKRRGGHASHSN